ncbi:MAG: hypothetical protein WCZ09_01715 [Bacilli bacterium]
MKRYKLLKTILTTIAVFVVLTYLIPATNIGYETVEKARMVVGLWDLPDYFIRSFAYFGHLAVFILVVGGFYGVLNYTGAYQELVTQIVKKFKGKEHYFLIYIMVMLAVISSFAGVSLPLFFLIPFIITVILLLGYDRLTALAVPFGSILVGVMGSTYANDVIGVISEALAIDFKAGLISRLFLLLVALTLLILYVLKRVRKSGRGRRKKENIFIDPLYFGNEGAKKSIWPIVIIIDLVLLLMIIGSLAWQQAFGIAWFENIYQSIMEFKIFKVAVFSKVLGQIAPFGYWTVKDYIILILLATTIIALIYKLKFDDFIEAFIKGSKTFLSLAVMVILIYVVLFIATYHPFHVTIIKAMFGLTPKFNVVIMTLTTLISAPLFVDITYSAYSNLTVIKDLVTEANILPVVGFIFQSVCGLTMLVAPTSVLLIIGLEYLKVPYIKWLGYIYRFCLYLLAFVVVTATVLTFL